jgi:hypothetical protein
VQAVDQASFHDSKLSEVGRLIRLPERICSASLKLVASITYSGARKKKAAINSTL